MMNKRGINSRVDFSAFLLISSLVSIGGLFGVGTVGAEVVDDPDQCPPNMDVIATNCHMLSEEYFIKQADAKAFCQNQTWEQKKGRLFTPTTREHGKAAIEFIKEQRPHLGPDISWAWTDWIKDPVTRKVISPSNPHFKWPTEPTLWNKVGRQEPDHPLESASSIKDGQYREACIVVGEKGAADVSCEKWRNRDSAFAICEFV